MIRRAYLEPSDRDPFDHDARAPAKRSQRQGNILGVLTLLGALVTSLVCVWLEGKARASAESPQAYVELKRQSLLVTTGDAPLADYLATIPTSLLVFLEITVWLSPLLVALLGFDAISGELQHRTVRFWTVRARRSSYITGKLLGLWVLVGLMTLALNVLAGGVALIRGYITAGELVSLGVRFWFVAFVIAGAWAALATFVSSCFKAPILALLTTFATFFVSWIVGAGGLVARLGSKPAPATQMAWYRYFYPNAYDMLLLSPETTRVLTALFILVAGMGLTTAAAAVLFARRDL